MKDMLKELTGKIDETLKPFGYRKKGNTFYCRQNGNLAIINLQKSVNSNKEKIVFTINIGICSELLKKQNGQSEAIPDIDECHWRMRIGYLLPEKNDRWWTISNIDDISKISDEIKNALETAVLPIIKKVSSDDSLISIWKSGEAPGLTELERIENLLGLLKIQGADDISPLVSEILRSVKGKPIENSVKQYLKDEFNYET